MHNQADYVKNNNEHLYLFSFIHLFTSLDTETKQVKCEVFKQTSQDATNWRYQRVFVLRCCISRSQKLSRNGRRGWGLGTSPSPMKQINVEIEPLAV